MPSYSPSWFCPNCGNKNDLNFKHCTQCGTALPPGAVISEPSPTPQKKSGTKYALFGCLGLVGFVFVIGIIGSVISSSTKKDIAPSAMASPSASPSPESSLTPKQIQDARVALKQVMAKDRQAAGKEMERNFLSNGMDVNVRVSGPENKTIKFQYVLWSRPLVYKLVNENDFLENLQKHGYNNVIFYDGYRYTWTYKYNEKTNRWE